MEKIKLVLMVSLFCFGLASKSFAAEVYVGVLEKIPSDTSSICMQGGTHFISSTCKTEAVTAKSDGVNIESFEGERVVAFGEEDALDEFCKVFRITSIYASQATQCGLVAGKVEIPIDTTTSSAKQKAPALILLLNGDNEYEKTVDAAEDGSFFFDDLENGNYELSLISGENIVSKTLITLSSDSPVQIKNFNVPTKKVPVMSSLGMLITLVFVGGVFKRRT